MLYFKGMCLGFGFYFVAAAIWILLQPNRYRLVAMALMKPELPKFFTFVSVLMVAWVGYTWYRFLSFQNVAAFIFSFIFSLSLIKIYFACFRYEEFRQWSKKFLGVQDSILRTFAGLFGIIGVLLVVIARGF